MLIEHVQLPCVCKGLGQTGTIQVSCKILIVGTRCQEITYRRLLGGESLSAEKTHRGNQSNPRELEFFGGKRCILRGIKPVKSGLSV